MTNITLRESHPSDLPGLYRICHATALNGDDASPSVPDPELIGHSYVGPYAVLEPEHCFIALRGPRIVGYIVAAPDSTAFHLKCEALWFPALRSRYPQPPADDLSPTARFIRTLHLGHQPSSRIDPAAYPASLHIDLLPEAQNQGVGRRLMARLFEKLKESHVAGVHLYVGLANVKAIGFYERIGFKCLDDAPMARGYGTTLS